jgi:hypothetical protein
MVQRLVTPPIMKVFLKMHQSGRSYNLFIFFCYQEFFGDFCQGILECPVFRNPGKGWGLPPLFSIIKTDVFWKFGTRDSFH